MRRDFAGAQVNVALSSIELDTSIQCRAVIDTGVINDYAERMTEGDKFPPVELFGTVEKCWIGDGWHRTLAAKSIEQRTIEANLHPGGRADALKHALGANATNGHRRTNADKRRCVEIALREFPNLSSRALAQMCGVSHVLVNDARPRQLEDSSSSTRMSLDGKERPAHRPAPERHAEPEPVEQSTPKGETPKGIVGPPSNGNQFARMAIMDLEQIRPDDAERDEAFESVLAWISQHWTRRK